MRILKNNNGMGGTHGTAISYDGIRSLIHILRQKCLDVLTLVKVGYLQRLLGDITLHTEGPKK